jgi:MoxR-like ATPase
MTDKIDAVVKQVGQIILGKDLEIKLVITCLLANGHLLIEDIPGVGKTTLAQALAKIFGLNYSRIQCTSDLLPADIVGVSVFNQEEQQFSFQPGPIFSQMVLSDELNRATPRTQSALLEAMEERRVSIDGKTHELPQPFFVIATQNQRHHVGTFPLPESQLDRFLMRLHLGYPDPQSERHLLTGENRFEMIKKITPIMKIADLLDIQTKIEDVFTADPILDYVQQILAVSRSDPQKYLGLSPRAGISLLRAAKAWAFCSGRQEVLPEDIQAVAGSVLEHRLDPEGIRVKGDEFRITNILIESITVN